MSTQVDLRSRVIGKFRPVDLETATSCKST